MKRPPWLLIALPFLCLGLIAWGLYAIYWPLAPIGVGAVLYSELYMYYRNKGRKQ